MNYAPLPTGNSQTDSFISYSLHPWDTRIHLQISMNCHFVFDSLSKYDFINEKQCCRSRIQTSLFGWTEPVSNQYGTRALVTFIESNLSDHCLAPCTVCS